MGLSFLFQFFSDNASLTGLQRRLREAKFQSHTQDKREAEPTALQPLLLTRFNGSIMSSRFSGLMLFKPKLSTFTT